MRPLDDRPGLLDDVDAVIGAAELRTVLAAAQCLVNLVDRGRRDRLGGQLAEPAAISRRQVGKKA
jgi:hypothetical protein